MRLGLQGWIHRLEEGEGVRLVKAVTFVAAWLALAFICDTRQFQNFSNPESMDAAQTARNLSEGRGFTTQFIRPLSVHLVEQKTGNPMLNGNHPDLANPPLYPLLLAGWMKLWPFNFVITEGAQFGAYSPELLIACLNQGLFLLLLWLVFGFARKNFDEPVAWVSVCALAGTSLLWRFSISGLSTLLAMVLVMLVIRVIAWGEMRSREGTWGYAQQLGVGLALGTLCGLTALTQYSLGWLMVPVVVFCISFLGRRRVLVALVALLAFGAMLAPWMKRNHDLCGAWFGVAGYAVYGDTDRFPGNRMERSFNPVNADTPADVNKVDLGEYWDKWIAHFGTILLRDIPRLGGSWLAVFFITAWLLPYRNPLHSRLRLFAIMSLFILACVQALIHTHLSGHVADVNSENLLIVLAPLAFVYGAGLFSVLLDQWAVSFPPFRNLASGGFVVVVCLPLIFDFLQPRVSPMAYPPYYPPVIQQSAGWLENQETLMSDIPWAVAWYGNRSCVWLTWDPDADFQTLRQKGRIVALYLTQVTTDARFLTGLWDGREREWGQFAVEAVAARRLPANFPLKYGVDKFLPDQLFLADRERWPK
jgi:hypothetical protein